MGKNDKKNNKKLTKRTLHYYWQEVKAHKWLSLGWFITTPLVILVRDILMPLVFATLIEKVTNGITEEQMWNELFPQALWGLALYIFGSAILGELRLYFCWKMEILGIYDLGSKAFNTISEQSMQFHSDRFSGSLVSQTNKFVGSFERFMDIVIWQILPFIYAILFTMIVLWNKAPFVAIGLLVFTFVYGIVAFFAFKKISPLNEAMASAENKQTGQLADSISNILSVKSYAKEAHEKHRFANYQKGVKTATNNLLNATVKRDVAFFTVNTGILALILFFLVTGTVWFGFTVSTLVLVVTYSQRILGNLWDINSILRGINRVFGDAKDMTEILDTKDDVVDAPNAKNIKNVKGKVVFDEIEFKHADAQDTIFKNFSLNVEPGERVGLVGVSGSGKTTLTKLLLRFADVKEGSITVDGENISEITQKSLRENIAYVPQETALFHRSVAENIAYGKPNATQEEIERAAKLANAHDFILKMPDGYKTLVGERGIKLSGGQRQRIAIARAILKDAPILVLDEATSALDSESEALIQDALEKLMKGRTSIVIAHRLSTVANLDRIVVLENGKIKEQGSHQELIDAGGAYNHLWSRQSGAFLDEE